MITKRKKEHPVLCSNHEIKIHKASLIKKSVIQVISFCNSNSILITLMNAVSSNHVAMIH